MPFFRGLYSKGGKMMRGPVCKYCGSRMETVEGFGRGGFSCLDRCPSCGALARFEVRGGQLSAVEWVVGRVPGPARVRPWVPEPLTDDERREGR